jgi:hypothetical protein
MDPDGYPDGEELEKITNWPYTDLKGLMEYVKERWNYADWGWNETGDTDYGRPIIVYEISTGGWSGNESLIQALGENLMFWNTCWYSSRRGGHYIFHMPDNKEK